MINFFKNLDTPHRCMAALVVYLWVAVFTIVFSFAGAVNKNNNNMKPNFAKLYECPTTQVLCWLSQDNQRNKTAINITLYGKDGLKTIPYAEFDGENQMNEATYYLNKIDYDRAEDFVDLYNNGPR